jgi:hypothetical protein
VVIDDRWVQWTIAGKTGAHAVQRTRVCGGRVLREWFVLEKNRTRQAVCGGGGGGRIVVGMLPEGVRTVGGMAVMRGAAT